MGYSEVDHISSERLWQESGCDQLFPPVLPPPAGGDDKLISTTALDAEAQSYIITSNFGFPAVLPAAADDKMVTWMAIQSEVARYESPGDLELSGNVTEISFANGRIILHPETWGIQVDGLERQLRPAEYLVIQCLGDRAGQTVRYETLGSITRDVEGEGYQTRGSAWRNVNQIRLKLGIDDLGDPKHGCIRTVRKVGYQALQ